jgi:hypothetical protein
MHVLHTNILFTIQHDIIDTKRISLECVVDNAQKILQDPKCAHLFCKQTYLFLLMVHCNNITMTKEKVLSTMFLLILELPKCIRKDFAI